MGMPRILDGQPGCAAISAEAGGHLAVSPNWGSFWWVSLDLRLYCSGVYMRAPDFWKLPREPLESREGEPSLPNMPNQGPIAPKNP